MSPRAMAGPKIKAMRHHEMPILKRLQAYPLPVVSLREACPPPTPWSDACLAVGRAFFSKKQQDARTAVAGAADPVRLGKWLVVRTRSGEQAPGLQR